MSSSLRVNTIVPSTGTNVAIGTANGTVTFTDSVNFVLGTGSSIFSPASNTLTFGTNDAERLRITSTGRIGINQASPEAMLQVDYDYANSEVGLRLRAASGSGTKTWQLSEINGNAGVFTIRNATNAQNILNIDGVNQRVGVNNTSPDHKVSVFDAGYCGLELKSNRSTATDNIGGLHFKTQSTNVAYIQSLVDGTINFRNTSSLTERLRIDANGRIGTNGRAPSSYNNPDLLISGDNATLTIMGDGSTNNSSIAALKFRVAGATTGDYTKAGIFAKRIGGYNDLAMIFAMDTAADANGVNLADEKMRLTSAGKIGIGVASPAQMMEITNTSGTGSQIQFRDTSTAQGSNNGLRVGYNGSGAQIWNFENTYTRFATNNAERLRITSTARFGFNTANPPRDYCFHSGQADTNIQITNNTTGVDDSAGALIQQDGNDLYIWNKENSFMSLGTNATESARLYANSKLHLGNSHRSNSNLSRLHVGWNTGGTVAGESIIAGTVGNDTTAVSALLTLKNAGNRGAQGASGGSSLAKFEFNNGTAFEIDKYGRRTLQYQPGCKVSIDSNGTGGGNNAQTGNTVIPFNSTGFGYNIGNHFNTSNHTFTAPLAGRYLVLLSLNVIGDNIVYIYKNGTVHQGGEYRSNPVGSWEHCELSGIVECSANDTIKTHSYLLSSSGGRKFNGGTNPGSTWDTLSIYYLG